MICISTTANLVHVPLVKAGFLKFEFDSTYPIRLNGIISQNEFRESINKINGTISSNKILIIFAAVFGLSIVGTLTLFILGPTVAANSGIGGFPPLVGVGFGVFFFGIIFIGIGCSIISSGRVKKVRQAIAEESMKYSLRSPTPCSWRLDMSNNCTGEYGHHHDNESNYCIVIEIGQSVVPRSGENRMHYLTQITSDPTSFFGGQNNYDPPPYSGEFASKFCYRCGVMQQDLTANFCSSCRQPFNSH